jgi:hypothetical protein
MCLFRLFRIRKVEMLVNDVRTRYPLLLSFIFFCCALSFSNLNIDDIMPSLFTTYIRSTVVTYMLV